MFGSRREPKLMDGRRIVSSLQSGGIPLDDALRSLNEVRAAYPGEDLMFGYWEYGDEIVVTISDAGIASNR